MTMTEIIILMVMNLAYCGCVVLCILPTIYTLYINLYANYFIYISFS